jgi:hypothetical protein
MTELDFDELDKAVSNIMSGVDTSKRKEGFDDPEDKVVEIPSSTEVPSNEPVSAITSPVVPSAADNDTVTATADVKPAQEVKTSEPLAVKRRGQFMDVMHPSSDMKTSVAPRREGVSLQPSSPFVASAPVSTPEEAPMSPDPMTTPVVDIVTPLDSEPATGTTSQEQEAAPSEPKEQAWPDPIDVAQGVDDARDADGDGMTDSSPAEIETVPQDVVNEVASPAADQPITSPFIADAKVEKRPLGTATPFPESVATPDAPQPAPVVASPESLPDELKNDVMALESSSTATSESKLNQVPEKASEPEVSKPNIPGSIPQQYTEQPSTGTTSNSAIYDTSTHHQPLEGGVKKSSPAKWIILGLVLLIVGALAGAAYFYFKTQ